MPLEVEIMTLWQTKSYLWNEKLKLLQRQNYDIKSQLCQNWHTKLKLSRNHGIIYEMKSQNDDKNPNYEIKSQL